ncbi:10501_t:CDS:2 [Ambispora gerdemannii]|uniref:10501_t:CDS:1 n=1 Tax=Ambispora gerdemannii TaxID=144530 RepID=A0A9N8YP14_9GLOM|nr:10501_t:CDS:2 [Ambispora gerdemannii]
MTSIAAIGQDFITADINTITSKDLLTTTNGVNAFPDPSEDLFWQKATNINEVAHELDEVWNPEKQQQQQNSNGMNTNNIYENTIDKKKEKEEVTQPIPPPPNAITNNTTRHSRKSSRVSWNLQTDSEKHVELLETKLKDSIANAGKLKSPTASDFGGTALATLGYHPEESTTIATALSATISAENDVDNLLSQEDLGGSDIPQEYDEGLWLLWRNNRQSSTNNAENNINDRRKNSARRKVEKEYLWGAGWWWWSAAAMTQRWIGCGVCGLEDDEVIEVW